MLNHFLVFHDEKVQFLAGLYGPMAIKAMSEANMDEPISEEFNIT